MRIVIAVAVAILTLVIVIVLFPLNLLRGPIASWASHKLDRPVTLAGDLTMHWRWPPQIEAADVTIGNPAGFDGDFFHVAAARVTFQPFSLLTSRPRLPAIELEAPSLNLARHADGARNWVFGDADKNEPTAAGPDVAVGAIRILRGDVVVDDAVLDAHIKAAAWTEGEGADAALHFGGDGIYAKQPFAMGGRGEGLSALRTLDAPYRLAFQVSAGATRVAFNGDVVPSQPENLRGTLSLKGQDASLLYPFVPVPIPWTPPYQLTGLLSHAKGTWRYQDFSGNVGASDMRGVIAIDISRPRPSVTADLRSQRFDYRDLGGFVGLPPGRPGQQASTTAQRNERAERSNSTRVLPDTEYPLDKLRAFDAELRLRGEHVKFNDLPFDTLDAKLELRDGVLRVDPLVTSVGAGSVTVQLTMDTTGDTAKSDANLRARNVDLKKLFPSLASPRGSAGVVNGYTKFHSTGNTIASMLGSADGQGALVMHGGEASTLTLVLTNLDLAQAGVLLFTGDKTATLRCAVAAYEIKKGVLLPNLFVVDTSAVTIEGAGDIDFAKEQYDLTLKASSKKASLFALHGPILVGGTFKSPAVGPAPLPIAARVGAAVGLAAIAPPLAILPFVDLGLAEDVDCRALVSGRRAQVALQGTTPQRN